jgi:peptide deformylase
MRASCALLALGLLLVSVPLLSAHAAVHFAGARHAATARPSAPRCSPALDLSPTEATVEEEVDPGEVAGLRVLKYPHPLLRAPNDEITAFDDELRDLSRRMFKLMYASKGVGLAAPQVGINKRLLVFNSEGDERKIAAETVLVNPIIVDRSEGTELDDEGCLSFPGFGAKVVRAKWIKVKAFNLKGKPFNKKYTGWDARIFQHEYDHLDGTLYVDRLAQDERELVKPDLDKLVQMHGPGGAL